jgi:hypothetical protein
MQLNASLYKRAQLIDAIPQQCITWLVVLVREHLSAYRSVYLAHICQITVTFTGYTKFMIIQLCDFLSYVRCSAVVHEYLAGKDC